MKFVVEQTLSGSSARAGRLHLPHGEVETPAFMPVGTRAAVKTLSSEDLEQLGYDLILSNTYHLLVRPGVERIQRLGGLHRFMGWRRNILTDSGGFQVMSLSAIRSLADEGVEFRSHIDGALIQLTPEEAVRAQARLGVDISMALDVCPKYPAEREELERAVNRTTQWAKRCLEARGEGQTLFGIVQGGTDRSLRDRSLQEITSLPFDGYALGGVSVGEPTDLQRPIVAEYMPLLPADKPRYLMGVGHPQDILHAVEHGADLFDCVLPTRMARHHAVYTLNGLVDAEAAMWAEHDGPWDPDSVFPPLQRYSAAYIRHLFKMGEPLAPRLATLHNLYFYRRLMRDIREAILNDSWDALKAKYANA